MGIASLDGDSGVYGLVLRLSRPRWVAAGRLGGRRLAAGWYVYVGSARWGLAARVGRHLRREKRFHWHIDYLRAAARSRQVWIWPWTEGAECRANAWIQAVPGAGVPWSGFGSSDCRCDSHLTWFPQAPFAGTAGIGPGVGTAETGSPLPRDSQPRDSHLTPGANGRILFEVPRTGAEKEWP